MTKIISKRGWKDEDAAIRSAPLPPIERTHGTLIVRKSLAEDYCNSMIEWAKSVGSEEHVRFYEGAIAYMNEEMPLPNTVEEFLACPGEAV
jgi:hypothetical protein